MKNDVNIKIYGTDWCSDCTRAKTFLDKYQVEYNWFNIELDKELQDYVREMNNGKQIVPTIVFDDESYASDRIDFSWQESFDQNNDDILLNRR